MSSLTVEQDVGTVIRLVRVGRPLKSSISAVGATARRGFGRRWIDCAYLRKRKSLALLSRTGAILICSPTSSSTDVMPGMLRQRFSARPISQEQHMRTQQWMQIAALASAIGITGTTFAAGTAQMKTNDTATSPLGKTPETAGVGGSEKTEPRR